MKKITVTLTDEAEIVFNELMYSLPKNDDGSGMCSQSSVICYALQRMNYLEQKEEIFCLWTYDEDYDCYNTDCGESFVVLEGTPEENHMKYCVYCGKELISCDPNENL